MIANEVCLSIKPNTGMCMALHILPMGVPYRGMQFCVFAQWKTMCAHWWRYVCHWLSWGYICEEAICLFCPDITSAYNTLEAYIFWKGIKKKTCYFYIEMGFHFLILFNISFLAFISVKKLHAHIYGTVHWRVHPSCGLASALNWQQQL